MRVWYLLACFPANLVALLLDETRVPPSIVDQPRAAVAVMGLRSDGHFRYPFRQIAALALRGRSLGAVKRRSVGLLFSHLS